MEARLTNRSQSLRDALLSLAARRTAVLAHVTGDVSERQKPDQNALGIHDRQPPHLLGAHDFFGLAQLIVRRAAVQGS